MRASSCAAPRSATPARTVKPSRSSIWAMRTPACPVAPATNTVPGSFRLGLPKDKPVEGLATTGIRAFTSDTLPKLKEKGLEPGLSSVVGLSSADESSAGLPNRKGGKGPALLAETASRGLRRVVSLEEGVVLRRNELEERAGAMGGMGQKEENTVKRPFCFGFGSIVEYVDECQKERGLCWLDIIWMER